MRAQALHDELLGAYPALRGNLSIPGMFVGYGLGSFVANGLEDDEIVAHVRALVGQIRGVAGKVNGQDDDATGP